MALTDVLGITDPQSLLYSFLLPAILVFAILWGLLQVINIFNRRINLILALGFTIATGAGGGFAIISRYIVILGPVTAVALFIILFIVGGVMWAVGQGRYIYSENISSTKSLKKLNEEMEKLYRELDRTRDESKRRAIYATIDDLDRRRRILERRMK